MYNKAVNSDSLGSVGAYHKSDKTLCGNLPKSSLLGCLVLIDHQILRVTETLCVTSGPPLQGCRACLPQAEERRGGEHREGVPSDGLRLGAVQRRHRGGAGLQESQVESTPLFICLW